MSKKKKPLPKKVTPKKGTKKVISKKRFKQKPKAKPAPEKKITPTEPPELVILFKVTSRSRPDRFKFAVNNIIEKCNNTAYVILASADTNDHTMNNPEIIQFCQDRNVLLFYGESKNKIDAINRDINNNSYLPKWDILINVSDDQYFLEKGFDDVIRNDFEKYFPEGDGMMHYPDNNRNDLMTMSIMDYKYYSRTNRVYFEKFESVYCDDAAMGEAKALGKYLTGNENEFLKFLPRRLYNHDHPAYGKPELWDDLYRQNESKKVFLKDELTFNWWKDNNFGIPKPKK